jgi:hypothetical protein
MDPKEIQKAIDLINRLSATERELQGLLGALGVEIHLANFLDPQRMGELLQHLKTLLGEQVRDALAKVNFRDDFYTFIRAIDGDTIVVEPPGQLRGWLKDIHVRLYGLEVPELWQPNGEEYRQHLHALCDVDAGKRLHIVWERERVGNQYEGFPLSSFERGIGHVFFERDRQLLYINGMMLTLPEASIERDGKVLLRGKRLSDELPSLPYEGPCQTDLRTSDGENVSSTFKAIADGRPPVCLLAYDRLPSLDPMSRSFSETANFPFDRERHLCPFSEVTRHRFRRDIERQAMSPFDIALWFLYLWSRRGDRRPQVENG